MKIRDEMDVWREHIQKGGVMTDKNKGVGRRKEMSMFLCELFRTGRIDKIGEPLFRNGVLIDDAVFRFFVGVFKFFVGVFRFFVPPASLEKAVEKGEKSRGGGALESAPLGAGERVHVDPFLDHGEEKERENVGSGSDVYGLHSG